LKLRLLWVTHHCVLEVRRKGKGGGEKVSPGEEGGEGMEYLEMAIVGIFVVVFIILRKMASVGEFSQYLIPF
jgi:hypothetical protein